jgi:hypothetical protein
MRGAKNVPRSFYQPSSKNVLTNILREGVMKFVYPEIDAFLLSNALQAAMKIQLA